MYCLLNYKYNHPSSLARRESTNTKSFLISKKPQDFPTVWPQRGEKEERWERPFEGNQHYYACPLFLYVYSSSTDNLAIFLLEKKKKTQITRGPLTQLWNIEIQSVVYRSVMCNSYFYLVLSVEFCSCLSLLKKINKINSSTLRDWEEQQCFESAQKR